jgi:hypothetical protein
MVPVIIGRIGDCKRLRSGFLFITLEFVFSAWFSAKPLTMPP